MGKHLIIVKSRFLAFSVCVFALCCLSCWDKQHHDISQPEFPHYILSGYIKDIDNSETNIPNAVMTIFPVQLIYDVIFSLLTIEADSTGYFQIDSIFPGAYKISVQLDGYRVASEGLFVAHENRQFDIPVPTPLINDMLYPPTPNSGSAMVWVGSKLWMFGMFKPEEGAAKDVIYQCQVSGGIFGSGGRLPSPVHCPDALVYANGRIYASKRDSVFIISRADGSLINTLLADEPIRGLAWTKAGFWSTLGYYFQFRGQDIKTVEESFLTEAEILGPLDFGNGYFWSYDRYRELLLKLDSDGTIQKSHRLIDFDTGGWIPAQDIAFEFGNRLWILSGCTLIFWLRIPRD